MTAPTVALDRPTGVLNQASGSFSGTYTAATDAYDDGIVALASGVITIKVGFEPKYIKVLNATDRLMQEWFKGLAASNFIETAANGTKTLETDAQVTLARTSTGAAPVTYEPTYVVTITAAGGAMTDNDTVVWEIRG